MSDKIPLKTIPKTQTELDLLFQKIDMANSTNPLGALNQKADIITGILLEIRNNLRGY